MSHARLCVLASFVFSLGAAPLFATDYTWTGGGDDALWTTPANWGQEAAYPCTTGDTAIFAAGSPAEAVLDGDIKINSMTVQAGAAVALRTSEAGTLRKLECTGNISLGNEGIDITLDRVYLYRNNTFTLGTGSRLSLVNGAQVYFSHFTLAASSAFAVAGGSYANVNRLTATESGASITVSDGSTLVTRSSVAVSVPVSVSGGSIFMEQSGGFTINKDSVFAVSASTLTVSGDLALFGVLDLSAKSEASVSAGLRTKPTNLYRSALVLDDSKLSVAGYTYFSEAAAGGARVTFKGANPVLSTSMTVYGWNNAGATQPIMLDFFVPEGGFEDVPFQNTYSRPLFYNQPNLPAGAVKINVTNESPAVAAGTVTTCPLVMSLSGFNRWDSLPDLTLDDGVSLAFSNLVSTAAATDAASAQILWATMGSGEPAASSVAKSAPMECLPLAVARHVVTATGYVSALSATAASTVAELYEGTADDKSAMVLAASTVVTEPFKPLSFSFTAREDEGEVVHYFYLLLRDLDANGETLSTAETKTYSAATKDETVYTWQAVNGDWNGDWRDPAHWKSDYAAAYDYPMTANCTAFFPAGNTIAVTISENETVGTIDLRDCGVTGEDVMDITFKGAAATGTNRVLTVATKFNIYGPLGTVTIDNAAIKVSANNETKPGSGRTFRIVNGANFYSAGSAYVASGSTFELSGRSFASVYGIGIEGSAKLFSIDDSTAFFRAGAYFDTTGSAGARIRIAGSNPLVYWTANADAFKFNKAASLEMIFSVPAGGYAEPPIQCVSTMANALFNKNSKASTLTLSVDPESPVYSTAGSFVYPLVAWSGSKSIDTANLVFSDVADGGGFLLGTNATEDYGFSDAASFSGTAKSMGVRIVSPAHDGRLAVASDAAAALDGYSPALGVSAADSGASVTATAPTDVVLNGVHYVCTGWTLQAYEAGTAATPSGEATEGSGASAAFEMPEGGASIEWHYAVDYPVTATALNDAGGSVSGGGYMTSSSPVTLTASTATDGMEFQFWHGDVPYANRYDNPLTISGDKAASVEAFFGATAANSTTRYLDASGGAVNYYDASNWTGGIIAGTNETAVIRGTSYHSSDGNRLRVLDPSFIAAGGLVVSNATLQIGTASSDAAYAKNPPRDQNGYPYDTRQISAYDATRTAPVGLDVFGDVLIDDNAGQSNGGAAVAVGGMSQRCFSKVDIHGDLTIKNGAFIEFAGHPFDFVLDPNKSVDGPDGVVDFPYTNEFWRGGNFLKVAGDTVLAPTTGYAENYIHVANDFRTGAAVWLDLHDVEIGEGSAITAYGSGYGRFTANGDAGSSRDYSMCPGGHSKGSEVSGGSHGGRGGSETANSGSTPIYTTHVDAYGFEFAPLFPGSCNGDSGITSRGGGSIRLDCGKLTLDGGIAANGVNGAGKGGSAGGSVWIVCDKFIPGGNCKVSAEGGKPAASTAGGGGGRILVCEGLSDENVDALYATHAVPRGVTATALSAKIGERSSAAALVADTICSCGEDGTAWYLCVKSSRGLVFYLR